MEKQLMTINNYTLWCPHCEGPLERIGEDGVCYACHNQTVLSRFNFALTIPVDEYTHEKALQVLRESVAKAVALGLFPVETTVTAS
jgi:hypothetical protein